MAWRPIVIDEPVLRAAWRAESKFALSCWDSLIVAAAQVGGCPYLLTEDLTHGESYDGVTVVDPFGQDPPG